MTSKPKPKMLHLVSAGGVVYRSTKGSLEVVLCGRQDPATWSLPKGTPDQSERIENTAVREAQEETGLEVALGEKIGEIEYWFQVPEEGVRCHKVVHFYLMGAVGGSTDNHDPEFDQVAWFPIDEAANVLTYANEARILRKAAEMLRARVWRG